MDEAELIARIRQAAGADPAQGSPELLLGPGDDAAIVRPPPGHDLVWTTDDQVAEVHFRASWTEHLGWAAVGRKAAGASVSDLAAMGARPLGALLSLGLPEGFPAEALAELARGLGEKLRACACPLLGGNLTRAPGGPALSVSCLGAVPQGRALLRSAGRAGDTLFVSGPLGGAQEALTRLLAGERPGPQVTGRLFDPVPRLALGQRLAALDPAPACMDLSDGLARDLPRLLRASGVAARVEWAALPGPDPTAAWRGGEDYELLIAGPATLGAREPTLIPIGELIAGPPGEVTLGGAPSSVREGGFDHFA